MHSTHRPGRASDVSDRRLPALERLRRRKDRAATLFRVGSLRRARRFAARARRRDLQGRGGARPVAARPGLAVFRAPAV